jgi:hypothetical protein
MLCGGSFGETSRWKRQIRYRRALPEIAATTRAIGPQEIWVGNDARPETHRAFEAAAETTSGRGARDGTQIRGVYIEDGLTAYAASVKRPLNAGEQLVGRVFFGRYWSGIAVLGTSNWISTGLFIFPSLVRRELAHLEKVPLPRDCFFSAWMRELAEHVVRQAGSDVAALRRLDAIVAVSHSSVARRAPGYQPGISALVERLVAKGCTVGVKYHPRQAEADYLGLTRVPGVVRLPQGLPLEYIYILRASSAAGGTPVRFVVGDVSTILLTARWLLPEACCLSLARPLGMLDDSLSRLFEQTGVQVPDTLNPFSA